MPPKYGDEGTYTLWVLSSDDTEAHWTCWMALWTSDPDVIAARFRASYPTCAWRMLPWQFGDVDRVVPALPGDYQANRS